MSVISRPSRDRFRQLAKDPLTIFVAAGAAIFALYAIVTYSGSEPVRYTAEIEAALVEDFELVSGRKATEQDVARLKDEFLTDELLFREGLAQGVYLTDSQIKARVIEKVRFLVAGTPAEPDEMAVLDFYAENIDRYESEPQISFEQVFFEETPAQPDALLAILRSGKSVAADDMWTGPVYPDYGHSMIRGIFGQPFLQQLADADEGQWYGPVQSGRGWHFVRKTGSAGKQILPFALVRDQVRQDIMIDQMQQSLNRARQDLEKKFEVKIDA